MYAVIRDVYKFRRILGDMTGLCNLRCRFCSTDFRQAGRSVLPLPVARSLRRLLDLVPEECFYLSFFFEPTLHPHFSEILASLGSEGREKAIFSTNMACDMDDDAIQALAAAPVKRRALSIALLQLRAGDGGLCRTVLIKGVFPALEAEGHDARAVFHGDDRFQNPVRQAQAAPPRFVRNFLDFNGQANQPSR